MLLTTRLLLSVPIVTPVMRDPHVLMYTCPQEDAGQHPRGAQEAVPRDGAGEHRGPDDQEEYC